jgi:maleate isomerase
MLMTVALTSTRKRLGVLTPSSNTVLEPVIVGLAAGLPNLSLHFTRFRVTEISLSETGLKQFAMDTIVEAARLLSDARVDAISWSGTSAAWLGLHYDRALCAAILKDTGTPATTATLSMVDALHAQGIRRIGLVTPYTESVQQRIIETFANESIEVVAESRLNFTDNFSFAEATDVQILDMAREVGASRPDAIFILCTNLRGAPLVQQVEREMGTPVLDAVVLGLLGGLRSMSMDFSHVAHAGQVATGPGDADEEHRGRFRPSVHTDRSYHHGQPFVSSAAPHGGGIFACDFPQKHSRRDVDHGNARHKIIRMQKSKSLCR